MRLWPLAILKQLPRQQLLGQHRECCALRGNGWGRKHATVDYVFKHPYYWLAMYHAEIMLEMKRRGYEYDDRWRVFSYRGRRIGYDYSEFTWMKGEMASGINPDLRAGSSPIYPEHDANYLKECIENLARKGIKIDIPKKKEVA